VRVATTEMFKTEKLVRLFESEESTVRAVDGIDLILEEHEFTVIMGSSGSGKSTLLYLLSGLDRPTGGEVFFWGERIDNLSETGLALLRRKGFGFVFQSINLIQTLSVLENVAVPGYLTDTDRKKVRDRALSLLSSFGIGDKAHRLPAQLSLGEQQRAAVARGLINEPAVLFADEPTGSLNFASGQQILDHLNDIHANGQTIVMVTHDLKAASRGKRVVFLRDGKLCGEFHFPAELSDVRSTLPEREKLLFGWLSERGW
jgi:putative ABC transport system ATP-binding protein